MVPKHTILDAGGATETLPAVTYHYRLLSIEDRVLYGLTSKLKEYLSVCEINTKFDVASKQETFQFW